ncbi:MAG: protein kinase domain-containing protein [Gemmatimonadales bacterium]
MTAQPASLITAGRTPTGERCAVKQLRPGDGNREDLALRLDNECRVLQHLAGTPGVIRLLGVREDPLALLLEWADGGSLDDWLCGESAVDAERIRFARDLVAAVAACHARGVTHRDIKPSNLLLVGAQLRVADFGLAAWGTPRRALPDGWEEDGVGTPPWSAPELGRGGDASVAPAVDIYGVARTLGVLLPAGELAAGRITDWMAAALSEVPSDRPAFDRLLTLL